MLLVIGPITCALQPPDYLLPLLELKRHHEVVSEIEKMFMATMNTHPIRCIKMFRSCMLNSARYLKVLRDRDQEYTKTHYVNEGTNQSQKNSAVAYLQGSKKFRNNNIYSQYRISALMRNWEFGSLLILKNPQIFKMSTERLRFFLTSRDLSHSLNMSQVIRLFNVNKLLLIE